MKACESCRRPGRLAWVRAEIHPDLCPECFRHSLYGAIVRALDSLVFTAEVNAADGATQSARHEARVQYLDGLDAIANLLTIGAKDRSARRKELNEAIRDGEREARYAYSEGRADGRDQADGIY